MCRLTNTKLAEVKNEAVNISIRGVARNLFLRGGGGGYKVFFWGV